MQHPDLIRIFIEPLEKNNLDYIVTGSIASIFYGEPRLTHDIDLVLHLEAHSIPAFTSLFPIEDFYCPPEEVIQIEMRRKPFGHFNLIHHRTGLKADIYTSSQDKLQAWGLKNKRRIELNQGFSFSVAPPEYVILRKLEFYREGGSDKHLEDIRKMLPQVNKTLNKDFLKTEILHRSLEKYAAQLNLL